MRDFDHLAPVKLEVEPFWHPGNELVPVVSQKLSSTILSLIF